MNFIAKDRLDLTFKSVILNYFHLIYWAIFFLYPFMLNAQYKAASEWKFPIVKYGVEDGLSQSNILTLHVDKENYLFLGTKVGVNRFNGRSFINQYTNYEYPNSYIYDIEQGGNDTIWVSTSDGLFSISDKGVYDWSGLFESKEVRPFYLSVNSEGVLFMSNALNNKSNSIWKLDQGELDIVHVAKNEQYVFREIISFLDDDSLLAYAIDVNSHETLVVQIKNGSLEVIRRGRNNSRQLSDGLDNNIYLVSNDSIFRVEEESLFFFDKHPLNWVKDVDAIGHTIAVANFDSLYIKIGKEWELVNYPFDLIRDISFSWDGSLWVATEEGVIRVITNGLKEFSKREGLSSSTWSIVESKENLLLPTYRYGLFILDENEYRKEPVIVNDREIKSFYTGALKLPNEKVLLPHEHGTVILQNEEFIEYAMDNTSATQGYLYTKRGDLYICSDSLIQVSQAFSESPVRKAIAGNNKGHFCSASEDTRGNVYAITKNKSYLITNSSAKELKSNLGESIGGHCIFSDSFGTTWLGNSSGLFNLSNPEQTFIPILSNIIDRAVNAVAQVDSTHLIIGSQDGIYILDISTYKRDKALKWKYVSSLWGGKKEEVSIAGINVSPEGRLLILTTNRLLSFNFNEKFLSPINTDIVFDNFTYLNEDGMLQRTGIASQNGEQTVHLSTSMTNVSVFFDCPNHQYIDDLMFSWKLEGLEEHFTTPQKKQYAEYVSLPSNNYNLIVRALIKGEVVDQKSISISVKHHSWDKYWLWVEHGNLILALVTLSLILALYKYKKNEQNKDQLLKIVEKELVASRIDKHLFYNIFHLLPAILKGMSFIRMASTIKEIFNLIEPLIASDSNLFLPLKEELDYTLNYLSVESKISPGKFSYRLNKQDDLDEDFLVPKFIIQSFVNNSIKHGFLGKKQGGIIQLEIYENQNELHVIVLDNGLGYQPHLITTATGQGNGQTLALKSLKLLDKSNKVKGSSIFIGNIKGQPFYSGTRVNIKILKKNGTD